MTVKNKTKVLALILVICVLVAAGGFGIFKFSQVHSAKQAAYDKSVRESIAALCKITVDGKLLPVTSYSFEISDVASKAKTFSFDEKPEVHTVEIKSLGFDVGFDKDTESIAVTVSKMGGGENVFEGDLKSFRQFVPENDGEYDVTLESHYDADIASPEGVPLNFSGNALYKFVASYAVTPSFSLSVSTAKQGDTIAIIGKNISKPVEIKTSFDYNVVAYTKDYSCYGLIPINHTREAGAYKVLVTYDGKTTELPFSVTETKFEVQHLTVSEETTSETIDNSAAWDEYYAAIYPLFDMADPNIYWSKPFILPVEGTVTTEYGIKRFTNDNPTPTRHPALDIAAAEGTPIKAANDGIVIYAGNLKISGNSVVIEHGLGLHTVYYHMSALKCAVGDRVSQGDIVGLCGSTGFATGPHLHYQVLIKDQSISPWAIMEQSSGIYSLLEPTDKKSN
ncbi:MAG: M23 family metallopeptidase [Oscillospiraceae bacterium]